VGNKRPPASPSYQSEIFLSLRVSRIVATMKCNAIISTALLLTGVFHSVHEVQAQISANVVVRLETLLSEAPGGDAGVVGCNIQRFVDNCVSNNIEGVSVELKRSDVNMNVASPQLGHLYFNSAHANTAVYTGKGYNESFLFDLLTNLRSGKVS